MEKSEKLRKLLEKFQADLRKLNLKAEDDIGVWCIAQYDKEFIIFGDVAYDKLVKMFARIYKKKKRIHNIIKTLVICEMIQEVDNDDTEPNENE